MKKIMNKIKYLLNWLVKIFCFKKQPIQQDIKKYNSYIDIVKHKKSQFHKDMDYLWKEKHISRGMLYALMSEELGKPFHTSYLYSENDFILAYECLRRVKDRIKRHNFIQDVYYDNRTIRAVRKPIKRKNKKFK